MSGVVQNSGQPGCEGRTGEQAPQVTQPRPDNARGPSCGAIKAKSRLEATFSNLRFYFFFPTHTTLPDLCPSSFPLQGAEGPGI